MRTGEVGRSYHFKISAGAQSVAEHSGAVFAVRFIYPREQAQRLAAANEARLARQALAVSPAPGPLFLPLRLSASNGVRDMQSTRHLSRTDT